MTFSNECQGEIAGVGTLLLREKGGGIDHKGLLQ